MYTWLSYTHCKFNRSWQPCCRITQTAPGQGSKPCYCLNPTGNKEGAGKAADGCLKYVPIETFPFLSSAWFSFRVREAFKNQREQEVRVEDPYWCCGPFPWETNTRARAHTHTIFHTQGGEWQTVRSCCYPFSRSRLGPESSEAFKDDTAVEAQVPLPCSFPGGGTQPAMPGGHRAVLADADCPAQEACFPCR